MGTITLQAGAPDVSLSTGHASVALASGGGSNAFSSISAYDHADWSKTRLVVSADTKAPPTGGSGTGDTLGQNGDTSVHYITQLVSVTLGTTYVMQHWLAPANRDWAYFRLDDTSEVHSCYYNVTTGAVGTSTNVDSVSIAAATNGWYLCVMKFTAAASVSAQPRLYIAEADGDFSLNTGLTEDSLYAWSAGFTPESGHSTSVKLADNGDTTIASNSTVAPVLTSASETIALTPGGAVLTVSF